MKNENTDNCHFLTQEEGKMKDCRSKGKDETRLTILPLVGNCTQTRQTKSKRISQGEEMEISDRCKKANK